MCMSAIQKNQLLSYLEIITACFYIYIYKKHALCGQNLTFLNIENTVANKINIRLLKVNKCTIRAFRKDMKWTGWQGEILLPLSGNEFQLCDFRILPQYKWDLHSSGMLCSTDCSLVTVFPVSVARCISHRVINPLRPESRSSTTYLTHTARQISSDEIKIQLQSPHKTTKPPKSSQPNLATWTNFH